MRCWELKKGVYRLERGGDDGKGKGAVSIIDEGLLVFGFDDDFDD